MKGGANEQVTVMKCAGENFNYENHLSKRWVNLENRKKKRRRRWGERVVRKIRVKEEGKVKKDA